ncbi:hypothetical protein CNR22_23440 [Sphingobacteriaceae bacterium]|nr:hypothetical protein CNR22_23440 [Sphingobacteriaceae bacterium]
MNEVEKYFYAEKNFCLFGIIFGFTCLLAAAYFLIKIKHPFFNGMAYPFVFLGGIFLAVCGSVYLRSSKDISRVNTYVQTYTEGLKKEELPRMQRVLAGFKVIIGIEIALVITSAFLVFMVRSNSFVKGIFTALLIFSPFLLLFDVLAKSRAKVYLEYLNILTRN